MISILKIVLFFVLFIFVTRYIFGFPRFDWRIAVPITKNMTADWIFINAQQKYYVLKPEIVEWCKENNIKIKPFYYFRGIMNKDCGIQIWNSGSGYFFPYLPANHIKICNWVDNKKYAILFKMRWG